MTKQEILADLITGLEGTTITDMRKALQDGDALEECLGLTDDDQEAIEEAHSLLKELEAAGLGKYKITNGE